jgi:aryl-alcohol dehydrogenase-like predicted oxidoreductase
MQYTYLGRTGVQVSRLCLGCMSYGDPKWRPWVLDEQAAMPFFRKAIEAGINFFDTADMYSLGVSEEITGKALRQYAKLEQVVIATKVFHRTGEGLNMKGLSRKHIQQGCEASLRRLGVETLDLYQVHRFDPHTPLDEMLSALDLVARQGKVRYIGASSAPAWQFAQALSLSERHGWARFVSMQNHYNLVYREEEREMMPLCEAEGIAVIPWSPLARGLPDALSKLTQERGLLLVDWCGVKTVNGNAAAFQEYLDQACGGAQEFQDMIWNDQVAASQPHGPTKKWWQFWK